MGVWRTGLVYFALVFVLGFVLGTIRVLYVVPAVGEFAAVAVEVPFMLVASWFVAGWLLRRATFSLNRLNLFKVGGSAFAWLMLVEAGLSIFAFGRTPEAYFGSINTPAGWLGLLGQVGFAVVPYLNSIGKWTPITK